MGRASKRRRGLEDRALGETGYGSPSLQHSRLDFRVDFPGIPEGEAGDWEG